MSLSHFPDAAQAGGLFRRLYRRAYEHFLHPSGLFQVVGLVACYGVFVAHRHDQQQADSQPLPLTISNQGLFERAVDWLIPGAAASEYIATFTFGAFAVALLFTTWHGQRSVPGKTAAVLLQMLIGLFYNNDLLLLLAAQLPVVMPTRRAVLLLSAQTLGMVLVWNGILLQQFGQLPSLSPDGTMTVVPFGEDLAARIWGSLLLFTAWQIFAFGLGYMVTVERSHRDRLAVRNAELRATQQLLAESDRAAERLRIARELHDGLGHHLTALGLHQELALRRLQSTDVLQNERAALTSALQTARDIAQELFREVRRAVDNERAEQGLDLEGCLRTLCDGIPAPQVTLHWDPALQVTDPVVAHTLFRVVQEGLSNACRHAQAQRVEVRLGPSNDGLWLEVSDDGNGRLPLNEGNGLRGLRERIAALQGIAKIQSCPDGGLMLRVTLPLRERSTS